MKVNSLLAILLLFVGPNLDAQPMTNFTIDLPHNILRYSLPRWVADSMPPWVKDQQMTRFRPTDRGYLANGFLEIAGTDQDFNGPFWVGAYGSLRFNITVQSRSPKFRGKIVTLDELDRYIRWWAREINPSFDFRFGRVAVGTANWLVRSNYNLSESISLDGGQRDELEIISTPIDDDMFLDVAFIINEWVPGSEKKWKRKAEELRETIKATIVLETK